MFVWLGGPRSPVTWHSKNCLKLYKMIFFIFSFVYKSCGRSLLHLTKFIIVLLKVWVLVSKMPNIPRFKVKKWQSSKQCLSKFKLRAVLLQSFSRNTSRRGARQITLWIQTTFKKENPPASIFTLHILRLNWLHFTIS